MKKMKKRILCGLLCLVMSLALLPTAAMAAMGFTDVTEKDWFYSDVEYAVKLGLVNGMSPTIYAPNSNLTYSAAIKLAACMHKKVTQGNTDFTVGTPWYQVYVDYAFANGIISDAKKYDWDANATRSGYMELFANAIPDTGLKNGYTELSAINTVDDGMIPDVPMSHPQAAAIYKLYRAGILQGSNAVTHQCDPDSYIRRSEVAAILTRMMNAEARVKFELLDDSGMSITEQPADVDYLSSGGKAVFSTAVTGGKGPYTYKWFLSYDDGDTWNAIVNDVQYSGVSTKKLTVKLDQSDAYTGTLYHCRIYDAAGHHIVTRNACVTAENSPLTVVENPVDVTAVSGDEVYFGAFAVGGKLPHYYQWQRKASDGEWQDFPIRNSGYETSKSNQLILTLYEIDFNAGYSYRCKITDSLGTVVYTTAATSHRRDSELTITGQPENVTCTVGDQADFAVTVTGGKAPYTYQWQWQLEDDDATSWSNLNDSSYVDGSDTNELRVVVTAIDFDRGYRYRCKITDASGNVVYSDTAAAIEAYSPLKITEQPQDVTGTVGGKASFSVVAGGGKKPYTYQWQYCKVGGSWTYVEDSEFVSGATSSQLDIVITEDVIASLYQYRCWVYDADHNFVCSDPVIVVEDTDPRIISQPVSGSAAIGGSVKFTMEVSGGKYPWFYQWQYSTDSGSSWSNVSDSTKYSGAQTSTLTIKIDKTDSIYNKTLYRCVFSDSAHHILYSDNVTATYKRITHRS